MSLNRSARGSYPAAGSHGSAHSKGSSQEAKSSIRPAQAGVRDRLLVVRSNSLPGLPGSVWGGRSTPRLLTSVLRSGRQPGQSVFD